MKPVRKLLLLLLLAMVPSIPVSGAIDALVFKNEAQEKRYRQLAEQLRCLVCQNQSLADSNADLARDLRIELLRQINQEKTDQEIIDYLVARYGDFVRYKPPFNPSTWLLWTGPFLILLIALLAMVRVMRSREHTEPVAAIDQGDAERLRSLLSDNKEK
jgi:cytochrome c-type biogenesis protein CcmH